jgi:polysaccharide pyruvyl transferase WcaK-like protein
VSRITILGSYTGRNAGDAAILENVVRDIATECPEVRCEVLTINPRFVRETYPDLPLDPVATLPWNLSVKTLGWPLIRSVLRCDAVVVTSAILFDRQLWNPLYNYLSALMLGLPLAKRLGKKVFFYSVGIGPVYTPLGRRIVRGLLALADGITLREEASIGIMKDLGVSIEPIMAADPALNQKLPPGLQAEVEQMIAAKIGPKPWASVNLNAYVDDWTGKKGTGKLGEGRFCAEMAAVVRRIVKQWGWGVVLICTHYMDEPIMQRVLELAAVAERVFFMPNRMYDHRHLMAAMAASEFMIGMRLHCQILAVAAGTPCVALNYAPKVRHFMEMANLEQYTVDFADFSAESVLDRANELRNQIQVVRGRLLPRVAQLQQQARISAQKIAALLRSCA